MLNLDQVRLLENRVGKAVEKIQSLTSENTHLRSQLSGLQTRVGELEGLVRSFKDDQGRIEEGILNALDRLSAFEDSVFHTDQAQGAESTTPETTDQDMLSQPIMPIVEDSIPESGQLDIEAEWQNTDTEQHDTSSSDGQMDIF